jgi:hypothetical protein
MRAEVNPSKTVPWFLPAIIPRLMSPSLIDLLENYSGILRDEQEQHLLHVVLLIPPPSSQHKEANHKQRDLGWDIFPFPRIGLFWWPVLGLSTHPHYAKLLTHQILRPRDMSRARQR